MLQSEPNLFSFAHGGVTYRLTRQPEKVFLQRGGQSGVADKLAQALSRQGDVFYLSGGDLVQALPGKFVLLDKATVQYLLGHRVLLVVRKDDREQAQNITSELVALACAALGQKPNQTPPNIETVTSLPYVTADGQEVFNSGYCTTTKIFKDRKSVV